MAGAMSRAVSGVRNRDWGQASYTDISILPVTSHVALNKKTASFFSSISVKWW